VSTPRNIVNLTIFSPEKILRPNMNQFISLYCDMNAFKCLNIKPVRVGTRVQFLRACSYAPFSVTAFSLRSALMQHTMNFSLQISLHISNHHIPGVYFVTKKSSTWCLCNGYNSAISSS